MNRERRRDALWPAVALVAVFLIACAAQTSTPVPQSLPTDNDELRRIYEADQAARENLVGTAGNEAVTPLMSADRTRRARVLDMYVGTGLHTGPDYYHAAMVFQHGEAAAD